MVRGLVGIGVALWLAALAPAAAQAPSICPDNFAAFAGTTEPLACTCDAAAAERGSVWGMDVYTGDSAICRAALHAGAIDRRAGGAVSVVPEPGRGAYAGVTRNGVSSSNYGAYESSFRFARAGAPATPATAGAAAPPAAVASASVCPDNFVAFAGGPPLACTCAAEAVGRGSVWGMDVYTGDSAVCRAALHAGLVGRSGGPVTVVPEAGRAAYAGVTRNGVTSSNFGAYASSFRFAPSGAVSSAAPTASAPAAQVAASVSVCPDNFAAFADTTDPLTCTCSGEAASRGSVWGMDVYTGDSAICRAALHAGAAGRGGGTVTVLPEGGRQAYAGVTRNGVSSSNFGAYASSFRFAAAGAPAGARPAPQAAAGMCPDNFVAYAETGEALACTCDAEAVSRGSVWGMDVYTGDSAVCRAALHAGIVGRPGGPVSVRPEPGRNAYAGVTRNGVSSSNYGVYGSSFRFDPAPGRAAAPPVAAPAPVVAAAPVQQPIAETIRQRGEVALYIRFKFNAADLDMGSAETLLELRNVLRADPSLRLLLVGHTDAVGAADYNRRLSQRRADATKAWLVGQGIPAPRLTTGGQGADQPLADNATEEGRAANRRVQAIRMP